VRTRIGSALILVPSVSAVVLDGDGRVLLARHAADKVWGTPGGAIEPDEAPHDAVVREVWEETRLHVEPIRLRAVVGGPQFRVTYPNGDQTGYVSCVFECRVVGGTLQPDGEEVLEARFFSTTELATLLLSSFATGVLSASPVPVVSWRPPSP
jgi:ADP-ribose pyrophosphatase YjhB (NUDIX family)